MGDVKKGLELIIQLIDNLFPKVDKVKDMVAEYEVDRRRKDLSKEENKDG